jgi:hypothetical protein
MLAEYRRQNTEIRRQNPEPQTPKHHAKVREGVDVAQILKLKPQILQISQILGGYWG